MFVKKITSGLEERLSVSKWNSGQFLTFKHHFHSLIKCSWNRGIWSAKSAGSWYPRSYSRCAWLCHQHSPHSSRCSPPSAFSQALVCRLHHSNLKRHVQVCLAHWMSKGWTQIHRRSCLDSTVSLVFLFFVPPVNLFRVACLPGLSFLGIFDDDQTFCRWGKLGNVRLKRSK